jgi:hypothetical protein
MSTRATISGILALVAASTVLGGWVPIGPAPATGGQNENVGTDNAVVGAIHALAPHPTDPDTLYVGTVNGGVWKTTNATAPVPLWYPSTSAFRPSIGALEFDPLDAAALTLVAANGQFSSFYLGGELRGLLRTTNGGATWTEITNPLLDGESISGVAARGPVLVVTASPQFGGDFPGGVFRSSDTGSTWTRLDGNGLSGLAPSSSGYPDLVGSPGAPSRLYTAARGGAIYLSTNTGATWTAISGGSAALTSALGDFSCDNVELAVGPTGRLWVIVFVGGRPRYIGYTDNPTAPAPTWVAMDLPQTRGSDGAISNASNSAPIVIETATGGITGATNTVPVEITSPGHGLQTDDAVLVSGVQGNDGANGAYYIAVLDANRFTLYGSVGTGTYTGGGGWSQYHFLGYGDVVEIIGVSGNSAANGLFTVSPIDSFSFELDGTSGSGSYGGGGVWAAFDGLNPLRAPGGQGFVHASIVADPLDPDLIYVGGDRQDSPFPNGIGADDYSGRLFRGDASVPPTGGALPRSGST